MGGVHYEPDNQTPASRSSSLVVAILPAYDFSGNGNQNRDMSGTYHMKTGQILQI
jgi:hypothetical protein